MTNEQQKILAEARRLIACVPETEARAPLGDIARDPWPEPPPPEPEPRRRTLDTAPAAPPMDWWAAIDQRIEERVEQEREFMCALLAEVVADEREEHDKALADLRANLREAHLNALDATRAAQEKGLLELSKRLNDLVVAVSKLAAYEQNRAAAIVELSALPATRRSDVN